MTDDHKADPLDLDALAEVARKATPGPWEAEAPGEHFNPKYDTLRVMYPKWRESAENYERYLIVDGSYAAEAGGFKAADAEHIATFDPPTVLALLAALKEARARVAAAWDEGSVAGRNREHHTNMTREQAESTWPNPYRRTETP